ncbi:DNA topoisomerase IB [Pseudoduganella namucuonensis]|uniref:DNA topoisomerase n=1 Tax=Pseudoduganella namucuonensis TaxID=1035707 RepID=A0A1I7HWP1_9BURK|nr:DNA topoisomerase IB [Pseudoduganella namucuonensis]SFU65061.1 DNA topoisomerase-1 [Pseudoduganella namucuonensis]
MKRDLPATDAPAAAKAAGLRYVMDRLPGLGRRPGGKRFRYVDADGRPVRDPETLARIRALAIPPAWRDVWICPLPHGHLQATGRDARGRKQYRYHPHWRRVRDEVKYDRMLAFGQALPRIRQSVEEALKLPGLPREKVLATVVMLLQTTMMRIGNEEYARENKSFGLTTLRNRHVRIDGGAVEFRFRGKSGVQHAVRVQDRRLARIIRGTRDLPGQDLFQYVDDDGALHSVGSADVNDYLRAISGEDYTAKDFRTWHGTVLAALALHETGPAETAAEAKRNIVRAIETVAGKLGNTPSVCRKCYVHPAVLDAYLEGVTLPECEACDPLEPSEAALLALLRLRLAA